MRNNVSNVNCAEVPDSGVKVISESASMRYKYIILGRAGSILANRHFVRRLDISRACMPSRFAPIPM